MSIRTVGVLGCGVMGSGIVQAAAAAGYRTIVREVDRDALDAGLARIRHVLDEGVRRGKVAPADRAETLARISGTIDIADLAGCDLVIEAVVERTAEKIAAFRAVDAVVAPSTLLASNTSSIPITEIAAATSRPARVIGMHFFNPVPLMALVEITRGHATSDETYHTAAAFAQSLGKRVVTASDQPGFIVNRLLIPYLLEAIRAYERGLGTREDIDTAMTLGCGHPMGPLALADFIGLDTVYNIAHVMYEEFKEPALVAPPLLKRLVLAGKLGRKSGEGFYPY